MNEKKHLYLLWTNDSPVTADKMVFMYAANSLIQGWWEKVTLIIWGAPVLLITGNQEIRDKLKEVQQAGVHLTACKACADQLGATETLETLNIEVKYWGDPLTQVLKDDEKLICI